MTRISFRDACPDDAASIAALHASRWRDAYTAILAPDFLTGPIDADRRALWTARLKDPPSTLLVRAAVDRSATLVGVPCAHRDLDPHWGSFVDNLHVAPAMRGQGIGERLLRSAAREIQAANSRTGPHLWVFEANAAGLRFYRRLGGEVVERAESRIPAANGKTILRVYWPRLETLAACGEA